MNMLGWALPDSIKYLEPETLMLNHNENFLIFYRFQKSTKMGIIPKEALVLIFFV